MGKLTGLRARSSPLGSVLTPIQTRLLRSKRAISAVPPSSTRATPPCLSIMPSLRHSASAAFAPSSHIRRHLRLQPCARGQAVLRLERARWTQDRPLPAVPSTQRLQHNLYSRHLRTLATDERRTEDRRVSKWCPRVQYRTNI